MNKSCLITNNNKYSHISKSETNNIFDKLSTKLSQRLVQIGKGIPLIAFSTYVIVTAPFYSTLFGIECNSTLPYCIFRDAYSDAINMPETLLALPWNLILLTTYSLAPIFLACAFIYMKKQELSQLNLIKKFSVQFKRRVTLINRRVKKLQINQSRTQWLLEKIFKSQTSQRKKSDSKVTINNSDQENLWNKVEKSNSHSYKIEELKKPKTKTKGTPGLYKNIPVKINPNQKPQKILQDKCVKLTKTLKPIVLNTKRQTTLDQLFDSTKSKPDFLTIKGRHVKKLIKALGLYIEKAGKKKYAIVFKENETAQSTKRFGVFEVTHGNDTPGYLTDGWALNVKLAIIDAVKQGFIPSEILKPYNA